MAQLQLTSKLSSISLAYKLVAFALVTILLFLPNLLLTYADLKLYYLAYTFFVILLIKIGIIILGEKKFITMLKLWAVGATTYLLFAIPRIYSPSSLSPYFNFTNLTDRWLYSLLLPLILLGTLISGLIFIKIIYPTEFLKWGHLGLKIAILMRALQHSAQVFNDTKISLMLQNRWPDKDSNIFNLHSSWIIIRSSPFLISTALRNIVLYWFPWGWLCLEKRLGFTIKQSNKSKNKSKKENPFSIKTILTIILAGATAALTIFVRIPVPSTGGYLNMGDMAVIFCGLFLGGYWGAIASGIGSAIADLVGGFFIFTPITLIAKGFEALIAGTLGKKNPLWLALAGAVTVICYFMAEVFLPGMGFSAAISGLPFNIIQNIIGILGGFLIYRRITLALPK